MKDKRSQSSVMQELIQLRIACAADCGCTLTDLHNDLLDFDIGFGSSNEFRTDLMKYLRELTKFGAVIHQRQGQIVATETGTKRSVEFLGVQSLARLDWNDIKSIHIIAQFLGIKSRSLAVLKLLRTADGLRAAILKAFYQLPLKAHVPSLSQVRNALAIQSIGDMFSNELNGSLNGQSRLPEDIAILLASRNLKRPREIGSTSQLLAKLAAEAVGAENPDLRSLRKAIYRKFVIHGGMVSRMRTRESTVKKMESVFDLEAFAEVVNGLAKENASGWDGNRRAYISHVWRAICLRKLEQNLNEKEFKTRLAEAHRAGHLSLAIADLRDKSNISDIQESVTRYKNTEWHLIRVED